MMRFPLQSVRARLWSALALLSLAVICISTVTWLSLERVDKRLQELHRQTLSQVAQALELSKRSTDLATSAPYLLNQRSNFLINQEGQKLIKALDNIRVEWPTTEFGEGIADTTVVSEAIDRVASGVTDLIAASSSLEIIQTDIRGLTARLGNLRARASEQIDDHDVSDFERLTWWKFQSMTSDVLNAAYAGNLIGVGEEHRRFLRQRRSLNPQELTDDQGTYLHQIDQIVGGPSGVFEQRRRELTTILNAQNALFRIRHDAGLVSASASNFAIAAEQFLAIERDSSSSAIQLTKLVVAIIALSSLFLALISAVYVSRYVTLNMARISSAMVQLAGGDRTSSLTHEVTSKDEIGDLFRSFRSFRANALRLDRSNRQLNQQNALFQKVFSNISDGVVITDASGRITAQNAALEKILGLPTGLQSSSSFVELLKNSNFGAAVKNTGLSDDHRGFCELISEDGRYLELRSSRLPDEGRVWLCSDITERRKLFDRLRQIEKIETLGKVAGDAAHDFGNILSTIGTHAHLLESTETEESKPILAAINNAVDFGSSLTQRLLAFAKKQHLAPESIELNALVEGMVDLVEISLKPNVEFRVAYANSPIHVLVDPGQLESSLLNLVLNANQAIDDAGTITATLGMNDDEAAYISIEDTGIGIPDQILDRVVEPFFTTRSSEGGTGLGLSIVYGFIRQTGGDMKITSKIDVGTKIELTLPVASPSNSDVRNYHGKTVLLVEDEAEARNHAQNILESVGFNLTAVATGHEATEKMSRTAFDLIVTDLDLGNGTSGWALVYHFLSLKPTNQAVVVSGRLPDMKSTDMENQSRIHCLDKPLDRSDFINVATKIFEIRNGFE